MHIFLVEILGTILYRKKKSWLFSPLRDIYCWHFLLEFFSTHLIVSNKNPIQSGLNNKENWLTCMRNPWSLGQSWLQVKFDSITQYVTKDLFVSFSLLCLPWGLHHSKHSSSHGPKMATSIFLLSSKQETVFSAKVLRVIHQTTLGPMPTLTQSPGPKGWNAW